MAFRLLELELILQGFRAHILIMISLYRVHSRQYWLFLDALKLEQAPAGQMETTSQKT